MDVLIISEEDLYGGARRRWGKKFNTSYLMATFWEPSPPMGSTATCELPGSGGQLGFGETGLLSDVPRPHEGVAIPDIEERDAEQHYYNQISTV